MNHHAPLDLNSIDANPQEVLEVLKKHLSTKPELLTILNSINLEQEDGHSQLVSFCKQYESDITILFNVDLQQQSSHHNPERLATLQQEINTPGTLTDITKAVILAIRKFNEDENRNISKLASEHYTHNATIYILRDDNINNKLMQFIQSITLENNVKEFVNTFLKENLEAVIFLTYPDMLEEWWAERMQLMETCTNTFFDLITDKDSLDFYRRWRTPKKKKKKKPTLETTFRPMFKKEQSSKISEYIIAGGDIPQDLPLSR